METAMKYNFSDRGFLCFLLRPDDAFTRFYQALQIASFQGPDALNLSGCGLPGRRIP